MVCLSIVSLLSVRRMNRSRSGAALKHLMPLEEGAGGCGVSRHTCASVLADEAEKWAAKGCVWFILCIIVSLQ